MSRFRRLFHLQRDVRADVDAELEHHLDLSTARLMETGMARDAARAEAERLLGAQSEAARRMHESARHRERRLGVRDFADTVHTEARYVLRGFRRQPALTALVVGTLALGIGANAAIFPMADRLLFRTPAGLVKPGELHRLYVTTVRDSQAPVASTEISYPGVAAVRRALNGRAEVGIYGPTRVVYEGGAGPRAGAYASANALPLLGVRMAKGRSFLAEEDTPTDLRPVVIISHEMWRDEFGADPAIIGRRIALGSAARVPEHEIIGVTQPRFVGIDLEPVHFWVPVATHAQALGLVVARRTWWEDHGADDWSAVVRATDRVTPLFERDASAALRAGRIDAGLSSRKMTAQFGSIIEGRGPLPPTQDRLITTRLVGVSFVLLLVALANATNLLVARGARREREIAVRRALGVSGARLATAFFAEAFCIAAMAAAVATVLSAGLAGVVRSLLLPNSEWTPSVVDARAIAFTGGLALMCALVAGLASAARALRGDTTQFLRGGQSAVGSRKSWVRNSLLAAQSAMSATLLVGALLFVVSLNRVANTAVGYDIERLTAVRPRATDSGMVSAVPSLLEALARRPDVEGVAVASTAPLRYVQTEGIFIDGRDVRIPGAAAPSLLGVSGNFFEMMRVGILRGRGINASDRLGTPPVVVVNEEAARRLWPGEDPLGKCIHIDVRTNPCHTVVGVASRTHRAQLIEEPQPQAWLAMTQATGQFGEPGTILVRSRTKSAAAATFAADELKRYSANARSAQVWSYSTWIEPQLRSWKLGALLFGGVSTLALVLAVVGLYSVLAATVEQRAGEIGVRMALGATSGSVVQLIMRQGLRVVVVGVAIGLVVAAAASRVIAALLYGTSARDPIVYAAAGLVLLSAAALAALIPAVRAGRVDPIRVLRAE